LGGGGLAWVAIRPELNWRLAALVVLSARCVLASSRYFNDNRPPRDSSSAPLPLRTRSLQLAPSKLAAGFARRLNFTSSLSFPDHATEVKRPCNTKSGKKRGKLSSLTPTAEAVGQISPVFPARRFCPGYLSPATAELIPSMTSLSSEYSTEGYEALDIAWTSPHRWTQFTRIDKIIIQVARFETFPSLLAPASADIRDIAALHCLCRA